MPIYEYRCATCGEFDVMQRITEKPLRKCPSCKGKVEKLVSNTSFQLKGSGWYLTDYAGKGKEKSDGASSKDSAKSDAGATTGAESSSSSEKASAKASKGDSSAKSTANAA